MEKLDLDKPWVQFVLRHGYRANKRHLAHVLNVPVEDIQRVTDTGAVAKLSMALPFHRLFAIWHGRDPVDTDWPSPSKLAGGYEVLGPEIRFLASLVGTMSGDELAKVMTSWLRTHTGDSNAKRTVNQVLNNVHKIGLNLGDLQGGITVADAGREIGSISTVRNAIRMKRLTTVKVGRRNVIPIKGWSAWKSQIEGLPEGWIPLPSIATALGIQSKSKMAEFAKAGQVPNTKLVRPFGKSIQSGATGVWCIEEGYAQQLITDRKAGRPMPWHGAPQTSNLRISFKYWNERLHVDCEVCSKIWGDAGAPADFGEFCVKYPGLTFGAKRHLAMKQSPPLSLSEVSKISGRSLKLVRFAVKYGLLDSRIVRGKVGVTRAELTGWKGRKYCIGDRNSSWIGEDVVRAEYGFSRADLELLVADESLRPMLRQQGHAEAWMFTRQQCRTVRNKIGYTLDQAAVRAGVSRERFLELVEGANWRASGTYPLATISAVIKRIDSSPGLLAGDAAIELGVTPEWIRQRVEDGTIKLNAQRWASDRVYLTQPMMQRLRDFLASPPPEMPDLEHFLRLDQAEIEAGVSHATLKKWGDSGDLDQIEVKGISYYQVDSLRARARKHWEWRRTRGRGNVKAMPAWFLAESASKALSGDNDCPTAVG